jgi:hypothetical protein
MIQAVEVARARLAVQTETTIIAADAPVTEFVPSAIRRSLSSII